MYSTRDLIEQVSICRLMENWRLTEESNSLVVVTSARLLYDDKSLAIQQNLQQVGFQSCKCLLFAFNQSVRSRHACENEELDSKYVLCRYLLHRMIKTIEHRNVQCRPRGSVLCSIRKKKASLLCVAVVPLFVLLAIIIIVAPFVRVFFSHTIVPVWLLILDPMIPLYALGVSLHADPTA